jgi:RimJ/RimL family protein N-acetyltransferase
VQRLVAAIRSENHASRRVAERIGMRLLKGVHHWRRLRLLYVLERGETIDLPPPPAT